MIRNNFWRLTIVVLVVLWSLLQTYPPTSGDLITHFEQTARVATTGDTTISNIVSAARSLDQAKPEKQFANLMDAVGTNNISLYFAYDTKSQANPTTYILNQLQRETAGKIKLGLDLQGGTSFLVELDFSKLSNTNEITGALDQAVAWLNPSSSLRGKTVFSSNFPDFPKMTALGPSSTFKRLRSLNSVSPMRIPMTSSSLVRPFLSVMNY